MVFLYVSGESDTAKLPIHLRLNKYDTFSGCEAICLTVILIVLQNIYITLLKPADIKCMRQGFDSNSRHSNSLQERVQNKITYDEN